jgi:hypothetical protein
LLLLDEIQHRLILRLQRFQFIRHCDLPSVEYVSENYRRIAELFEELDCPQAGVGGKPYHFGLLPTSKLEFVHRKFMYLKCKNTSSRNPLLCHRRTTNHEG